jgi:hypothetical protein
MTFLPRISNDCDVIFPLDATRHGAFLALAPPKGFLEQTSRKHRSLIVLLLEVSTFFAAL